MMGRETLAGAVKSIAWGYVLLHVNINLGSLDILPNWLGYVLILSALPTVGTAVQAALLLRPLGILLTLWEGLLWGLTIVGVSWDATVLNVIGAAMSLYFHFQLLTNLSELAAQNTCPEETKLLRLRTVRTVLTTLLALPLNWRQSSVTSVCVVLSSIVVALWICSVLFSLRRSLLEHGPADSE